MESISKILIGNRFHSNFTHRQSLNLQALLTSETLKGPNKGRESKQTQDWSEYVKTPTATIKTLKLGLSQIIAFTGTSKRTSDVTYI